MRYIFLLAFTLISFSAAADLTRPNRATRAEQLANNERFNACLGTSSIKSEIRINVKIGDDGMVIGEPDVLDPKDTDEFRNDVAIVIARIKRCQPFKYYPPEKFTGVKVQPFVFNEKHPRDIEEPLRSLIRYSFQRCLPPIENAPTVVLRLFYLRDGTLNGPPELLGGGRYGPEYLRAAADLIERVQKCEPADWPPADYDRWQRFIWFFEKQ